MSLRFQLLFLLNLGLVLGITQVAMAENAQEKVDSVEVQLKISGQIYEGLQERIEFSIGRVGEQILLSQPLSLLQNNKLMLRNTIKNVFSKVLIGFKIDDLDLQLGKHSKIIVKLTPSSPLIEEIVLNAEVKELAPEMSQFVNGILNQINQELNQIFVGLPIEAIPWSKSIFKLVIDYLVARELPGFQAEFQIKSGQTTEIVLELTPEAPKVEQVKFSYQAKKLPIVFSQYQVVVYREKFNFIKGLPISFLTYYRRAIEQYFVQKMDKFSRFKSWNITVNFNLKPGTITEVELEMISQRIELGLEARLFVGESQNNYIGNVQAFLGYSFERYDISACYNYGKNSSGNLFLRLRYHLTPLFSVDYEYEPLLNNRAFCLYYQFENGNYLSMTQGATNETVIGFILNKNFNVEFLSIDKQYGLQLVYHL